MSSDSTSGKRSEPTIGSYPDASSFEPAAPSRPSASRLEAAIASDPNASDLESRDSKVPASNAKGRSSHPLQHWLLAAMLTTIGITGITSSVVGVWLIDKGMYQQATTKARLDLNSARIIYNDRLERLRMTLRLASLRTSLVSAVTDGRLDPVRAESASIKDEWGYDYLMVFDSSGRFLVRSSQVDAVPTNPSPLVSEVVGGKVDAVGTVIREASALRLESREVADHAYFMVPGTNAAAQPPREISAGLVMEGAVAVKDATGKSIAILLAGVLLNRDTATVDRIKETIFAHETSKGHATGGASLCLGDVRVATSIRYSNGERAVGTTVEPEVRRRVLEENSPLVDRALVLGDVYFTAYEPIHDPLGRPIGILSLGVPARTFTVLRNEAVAIFIGIVLCGCVVAFMLAGIVGRRILRPIQALATAMHSYAHGNINLRITPFTRTPTELVDLGNGLRSMASALRQRELQLKFRTEQQLGKSERLAMIGRLSAGVAHEINNPLGGILLFSSLLLKKVPADHPDRSAIERICGEAKRCQKIVQGLLDFARPREPKCEQVVLEEVVERTLQLVIGQSLFFNITVVKDYERPKPECYVDPAQLQQVVLNLVVNAAEAMESRGTLTIATRSVEDGGESELEISDSGCGISPENLERLFEPFFTTKEVGRGTGLGLSISRSIIESHNGTIWADSTVGVGTRFFIRLPAHRAPA